MSKIVFLGNQAGLVMDAEKAGKQAHSGDANSPYNYVVICTCGMNVGPLGRFSPNKDGLRTPLCACGRVIIIDRNGQIAGEKLLTKKELAKLATGQSLERKIA